MTDTLPTSPAFFTPGEKVDLTNCDREPIHQLGAIQPFGFLLAVNADWIVIHASESARRYLGQTPQDLVGRSLVDVFSGDALHSIRGRLQLIASEGVVERLFGVALRPQGERFDLALHYSGDTLIIEAEPCRTDDLVDANSLLRSMTNRISTKETFAAFCQEAARQVRALLGIDRVMVYRFAHDGSGEVIAESLQPGIDSFLGLHYPASDIPQQARKLYERNWLRIISDLNAEPSPIWPQQRPDGSPLDLSMSVLRSVSPIHIEYLRNMGVGASLSISILRGGRLWGLFACHHYSPLHVPFEQRTAAELFGQIFSLMLESRERELDAKYEARARDIQARLSREVVEKGEGSLALDQHLEDLCELVDCDGLALRIRGEVSTLRNAPDPETFKDMLGVLGELSNGEIFATHELSEVYPAANTLDGCAGAMVVPLSRSPDDFLVFFRDEQVREVNWAGDPNKPMMTGEHGERLTPRKSFEIWKQTVGGQARPWSEQEKSAAESLRLILLEVVLRLSDLAEDERRKASRRQEILIAELNHRVRNILALIRGVVSQSRASAESVEDFSEIIGGRIQALARAHDQITRQEWGPGALRDLILDEAGAYLSDKADRVMLNGPDVSLHPQAFSTLALVIHELMTNSAKYGALCDSRGKVRVEWMLTPDEALELHWEEFGGPPVKTPTRRGFGSTIIERSIPHDLEGEASIAYRPEGVRARILVPAQYVTSPEEQSARTPRAAARRDKAELPSSILIVEDNMVIAMEAEDTIRALGVETVRIAPTLQAALDLIDEALPEFAVLDLNLGSETSLPAADKLLEAGVPFAFASGFGDESNLPARFGVAPMLTKPYRPADLAGLFKPSKS